LGQQPTDEEVKAEVQVSDDKEKRVVGKKVDVA
jgi:hypothetical protein